MGVILMLVDEKMLNSMLKFHKRWSLLCISNYINIYYLIAENKKVISNDYFYKISRFLHPIIFNNVVSGVGIIPRINITFNIKKVSF